MIYLDNAATSFPKPAAVPRAVDDYLTCHGASPGRSGHALSAAAARIVFEAREALAQLLHVRDSRQIIFTANATASLNLALLGFLRVDDHVVTTTLEHNSVARPLRHLEESRRVRVTRVAADAGGRLDPEAIGTAVEKHTRLVVINHASNVLGTVAPLGSLRAAIGDTPLLVDGSQTVGAMEVDVERDRIDMLAFTGHKSLLGPQGTGGLYVRPGLTLDPVARGGTGSDSESDRQPETLPDRYESGTPNGPGIAGLGAAVTFLLGEGLEAIRQHESRLRDAMVAGLQGIPGVTIFGVPELPIISFRLAGFSPSEIAHRLDREYEIMTRPGLHCAPGAHQTIGTFPEGTVRLSAGFFNTTEEIEEAMEAIRRMSRESGA